MTESRGRPMGRARRALGVALAASLVAGLGACASDGGDATAAGPATTDQAAAPSVAPTSATWNVDELANLINVLYEVADRTFSDTTYWAASGPGILQQADPVLTSTIKEPPWGGTWTLNFVRDDYGSNDGLNYLGCAPRSTDLVVNVVVPDDNRSIAIMVNASDVTAYLVTNTDLAGQSPYDEDGYYQNSGGCTPTDRTAPAAPTASSSGSFS